MSTELTAIHTALQLNTKAAHHVENTANKIDPPSVSKKQILAPSKSEPNSKEQQPPAVDLVALSKNIDKFISTMNKGLAFRIDEASGKNVLTIYEMSTGEVIKQYPEEKMLKIAQKLAEQASGLINESV